MVDRVDAGVVAGPEALRIGFVGDDADGARLRACAVQRPLWSLQHFDALDVIDVNVYRAVDGRHRLLVEISADARL